MTKEIAAPAVLDGVTFTFEHAPCVPDESGAAQRAYHEHRDLGGYHVADEPGLGGFPAKVKRPDICPVCRAEAKAS